MSGVLKLEITESAAELQTVMEEQTHATTRSKVQILWWLKTHQATQVTQLSALSGYHRGTISRWLTQYRQGGLSSLLERRKGTGRPRAITGAVREALVQALESPQGFGSYGEIQQWLATEQGCDVPYKTVHKTVRYGLKAKLKVPRPTSERQIPGAVAAFKQTSAS